MYIPEVIDRESRKSPDKFFQHSDKKKVNFLQQHIRERDNSEEKKQRVMKTGDKDKNESSWHKLLT